MELTAEQVMVIGRRLLITVATMLVASFVAGLLWHYLFAAQIPSYLAGVAGGIAALPVWEVVKRRKRGS